MTRLALFTGLLLAAVPTLVAQTDPPKPRLTEKQVQAILRENDRRVEQVRRPQVRRQADLLEKHLGEYAEASELLTQTVEDDRLETDNPEPLLWKIDAASLKQRRALERVASGTPHELRPLAEAAIRAAKQSSRAAMDALTRLREGEFRLGGKSGSRIRQERNEDVWVPGPEGPRRRPRLPPDFFPNKFSVLVLPYHRV